VSVIGAEDTRNSGNLLKHYEIKTLLFSYHKFNERARVEKILQYLENGEDVALISDAGTPGISDPAQVIIREAIKNEIKVETLPGATAFIPALVSSGFNTKRFYFLGFLPTKKSEKEQLLKSVSKIEDTLIFYEAPHRLMKFFQSLKTFLGNRKVVIARELSKMFETYYRLTIDEILSSPEKLILKGEFVIVVEGAKTEAVSDEEIGKLLDKFLKRNFSVKAAVEKVREITGIPKNRIYKIALSKK
ncbi:MAG: 16S rRNA (cytidine(1402)-2'-O)-methyltransferase, partial [Candidatus Cloacimonadota bacterium]